MTDVLVIDDEPALRAFLREALRGARRVRETDRRVFLSALRRAPDPAASMLYAEWLEERGEEATAFRLIASGEVERAYCAIAAAVAPVSVMDTEAATDADRSADALAKTLGISRSALLDLLSPWGPPPRERRRTKRRVGR